MENKIIEYLETLLSKVDKLESDVELLRNEVNFRNSQELLPFPQGASTSLPDCGCPFNHPCNSTGCPRRIFAT